MEKNSRVAFTHQGRGVRYSYYRIMTGIPDIEKKLPADVSVYQQKELSVLLRYLSLNSPFYKNHFATNGVDVSKVNSLEDIVNIPPTTKTDLQNFNWDFLCVPRSRIVEYTSTSGTLGKPVAVALTENDLQRLAYNEALSFACADGSAADVYQLMLTLDRQFMAGMAYYLGIRKLGGSIVRVGPGVPAMQWDSIQRYRPTALVAVPSFLLKLIEYAEQAGIDVNTSGVKKAICIGESLRTADFGLSVIGKKIKEKWDIQLYSTYASTEMQTAFTECVHGIGGHHHPELIIVEMLDENGRPVPSGNAGEITITTLGVEGMPLLRYRTGDVAIAYSGRCSCGRNTMRIGPILGRKQHLIKLKGTTIYPNGIFEILHEISEVREYAVEAYTGALQTDELRIHVLANGEENFKVEQKLNGIFQSRLRVVPEICFVDQSELNRLQVGQGDRKIRKFIDNRAN
jgi:phenylacetate-CoA ligase